MDKKHLKKFITAKHLPVVDAMKKMDENGYGILFITDGMGALYGTVSDGDIRRWLIRTGKLDVDISLVMNRNPRFLYRGHEKEAYSYMAAQKITSVPIVDDRLNIVDIKMGLHTQDVLSEGNKAALKGTAAVIMAGGKGTRLYPYTKILPKPLIPIGDVPILERILDRFYRYGVEEFYLTVNYRKEMLKAYFDGQALPYTLHYIEEDLPLGTAGGIRLIKREFSRPVIVTNCDILIQADYGQILEYHIQSGNAMTIVSSLKNTTIPYGVLHSQEGGAVTALEEKPKRSYFINTGMYLVDPAFFERIPKGRVFHMTDLAEELIKGKERVGMYPVSENSFLDMGQLEEMKKMEEQIRNGYVE